MAKLAFFRTKRVYWLFAVGLAVCSVYCFWTEYGLLKKTEELKRSCPIQLEVDISNPCTYSIAIQHCRYGKYAKHGALLFLEYESDLPMQEIHSKLHGSFELLDGNSNVISQIALPLDNIAFQSSPDHPKGSPASWVLQRFTPEQKVFRVTVTKPVAELAGVRQTFKAYYLLNKSDLNPGRIHHILGVVLASLSFFIILTILTLALFKKVRNKRPSKFEDYIRSSMQNEK